MKIEILKRFTGAILFSHDVENNTMKLTVEAAIKVGASLDGASLDGADLTPIRADFYDVLAAAPREVAGLIEALKSGRVDGSTYEGECACLVGTIANVRHADYRLLDGLEPDSSRPIERFFMGISKGDTPETNQLSALAVGWAQAWLTNMQAAFGAPA